MGISLWSEQTQEERIGSKLLEDKGYVSKVCLCRPTSVPVINCFPPPGMGKERGTTFTKGNYWCRPQPAVSALLWVQRTKSRGLQKSCGEKGQHVHSLSERALTVPGQAFIAFWEYCIKEGLHSSLSDSNDQTVDNIPRTMRAYSESGSIS